MPKNTRSECKHIYAKIQGITIRARERTFNFFLKLFSNPMNRFHCSRWHLVFRSRLNGFLSFHIFAFAAETWLVWLRARTHSHTIINLVVGSGFITYSFSFAVNACAVHLISIHFGLKQEKKKKMTNVVICKRHNNLIVDKRNRKTAHRDRLSEKSPSDFGRNFANGKWCDDFIG